MHQPDGSTPTAADLTDLIHRRAHTVHAKGVRRGSTVSVTDAGKPDKKLLRARAR